MANKEDELNKALEALEKDSREQLSEIFSSLQSDLAGHEEARKEAEEKAEEAEKKCNAALALQKKEYSVVIRETFDEPRRDLIRKISWYSLGGIVITIVAATSFFFLTAFLQAESIRSLADSQAESIRSLANTMNKTRDAVEKSHQLLEDLDFRNAVPDEGVLEIVSHFDEEKSKFNGYKSKVDLARAYKISPVDSSDAPFYYYQYRVAFRKLELNDIPTIRELQRWDVEAFFLYDRWHESVSDLGNSTIPQNHRTRRWDSFKSSGDETQYNWWFSSNDATYSGISRRIWNRRDAFLVQWRKNKELLPPTE